MIGRAGLVALTIAVLAAPRTVRPAAPQAAPAPPIPTVDLFFTATSNDQAASQAALAQIAAGWKNGYAGMFVDALAMLQRSALGNPFEFVRYARLLQFLEDQTGQSFGTSLARWRDWVWRQPYDPHPGYGAFKGALYAPSIPALRISSASRSRRPSASIRWIGAASPSTAFRRSIIRRS